MPVLGAFIVPHPPIILPEVGRGEEKKIQKTIDAYISVAKKIARLKPDTILIISPHSVLYQDYFHISPGDVAKGDLKRFGIDNVTETIRYDTEFVRVLSQLAGKQKIEAGTLGEKDKGLDHGTLIPIRFINKFYRDYRAVRIGLSGMGAAKHYQFGMCIQNAAKALGRKVVIVASGDLSHRLKRDGPYGFIKEGPQFDSEVTQAMTECDFLKFLNFEPEFSEAAGECGLRSFIIMAGALDKKSVKSRLLSYEGPFGVGYAVCEFEVLGDDKNRNFYDIYENKQKKQVENVKETEDEYVRLARYSIENFIKTKKG